METGGAQNSLPARFRVGDYLVEPHRNRVSGPRGATALEPRIMDVLCLLAERAGEVVSRADLIDRLWGVEFGGDESLTRAVSQLRKTFGDARDEARVIETIPKRGYRLIAPVTSAEQSAKQSRTLLAKRWTIGGALAALAALAAASIALLPRAESAHAPAERTGIVLVVAQFHSEGANLPTTDFADALSAEIARNPLIRARTLAGAASSPAAPDAMRYVLRGSIRRAGAQVRVDAQLVDGASGDIAWSESYERPFDAAFSARDALVGVISTEAQYPLLRAVKEQIQQRQVMALSPWQLTLLVTWVPGAEAQRWEGPPTENSYWLQRRALDLDPDYAPAHALFAELSAYHALFHPPFDNPAEAARARSHAERAFQLAPYDSEVLYQLGLYHRFSGDRARAIAFLERVLELQPHHPQARVELAFTRGQCSAASETAIRELDMLQREMSSANPVRWVALAHQSEMLLARGEFARARAAALRSRRISPMTWTALTLAAAQAELGDADAAAATLAPHRREWPALDIAYFAERVASRWCLGGDLAPQAQASFRRLAQALASR